MRYNYPEGKPLTDRQQKVLEYMEEYQHINDNMPTTRNIQAKMEFSSQSYASQLLHILKRKGYLERIEDGSVGYRFARGPRDAQP